MGADKASWAAEGTCVRRLPLRGLGHGLQVLPRPRTHAIARYAVHRHGIEGVAGDTRASRIHWRTGRYRSAALGWARLPSRVEGTREPTSSKGSMIAHAVVHVRLRLSCMPSISPTRGRAPARQPRVARRDRGCSIFSITFGARLCGASRTAPRAIALSHSRACRKGAGPAACPSTEPRALSRAFHHDAAIVARETLRTQSRTGQLRRRRRIFRQVDVALESHTTQNAGVRRPGVTPG